MSHAGNAAKAGPALANNTQFPILWAEIAAGLILLAAAGFYWSEALSLPASLNRADVGAGRFPSIAGGLVFVAAAVMLLAGVIRHIRGEVRAPVVIGRPLWVLVCLILLIAQAKLFEAAGSIPVILIFSCLIMLTCGERRPLHLILTPVALTAVIYSLFTYALGIQLP